MEKKEYEFGQAQTRVRRGPGGPGGRMGGGEKATDFIGTWKNCCAIAKLMRQRLWLRSYVL